MNPAFIHEGSLTYRIVGLAIRVHGRLSPFVMGRRIPNLRPRHGAGTEGTDRAEPRRLRDDVGSPVLLVAGRLRSFPPAVGTKANGFDPSRGEQSSGGCGEADVPVVLRAKRATLDSLRRLWTLLPARWMPWAFSGFFYAAACLPQYPRTRVRSVLARLRAASTSMEQDYPSWIRLHEQTGVKARRKSAVHIASFVDPPLISILMSVVNSPPDHLRAAIKSVQDQFYPGWELCVADRSPPESAVASLLREAQARDPRIKLIREEIKGGIFAARNAAFGLASGSFIALLDHDDLISPRALYEVAARLVAQPAVDIIYSDQDLIDDTGIRSMPYFKPDWNPELMLGQNLIDRLGIFRRTQVERIGGFRTGLEGSQDYDLALRMVARTTPDRILHIPKVLYHRRKGSHDSELVRNGCASNAQCAVRAFLSRGMPDARVEPAASSPAWNRVIYPVPQREPLVSVVIPSRNHAHLLARAVEGLLDRTDYRSLEVLIVDNGSDEPAALALLDRLARDSRVRVLRCPGPFNYSALNNLAVREAVGSLILLLNNDIDVINPDWLREMVSHAIRPGIGAVGAKLLYPDGSIQHGGITVGMFGVADRQYLNKPSSDSGYFGHLKLTRNVTAVTAACLLIRRDAYLEVGGLNEISLPVAFNDVDLCLKLMDRGYRNIWTPFAELYHLESASRGSDQSGAKFTRLKREIAYMRRRWGPWLDNDPQWNPNLSLHSTGISLAFPPRDTDGPEPKACPPVSVFGRSSTLDRGRKDIRQQDIKRWSGAAEGSRMVVRPDKPDGTADPAVRWCLEPEH
jgi:glycosyltransferase involved in cell wall biosynthesis